MPDCEYCSDSFDDEDAYLAHLQAEHEGELGPIDRRRIEDAETEDGSYRGMVVLGTILLVSFAIVGFLVVGGGLGGDGPTAPGSVHQHGSMEIVIEGEELDLNEPEFTNNDGSFHFHGDEQTRVGEFVWHIHAQEVTLQYALDTLGIEVDDEGTVLRYDGRTYRDADPDTEVVIEVNDEPVEPGDYELQGVGPIADAAGGAGDDVRIVVRTDG